MCAVVGTPPTHSPTHTPPHHHHTITPSHTRALTHSHTITHTITPSDHQTITYSLTHTPSDLKSNHRRWGGDSISDNGVSPSSTLCHLRKGEGPSIPLALTTGRHTIHRHTREWKPRQWTGEFVGGGGGGKVLDAEFPDNISTSSSTWCLPR